MNNIWILAKQKIDLQGDRSQNTYKEETAMTNFYKKWYHRIKNGEKNRRGKKDNYLHKIGEYYNLC